MNKADLINNIHAKTQCTKAVCEAALDAATSAIVVAPAKGEIDKLIKLMNPEAA